MVNKKFMNTKKIIIATIILILTIVFIYGMTIISEDNTCSGVRSFNSECS